MMMAEATRLYKKKTILIIDDEGDLRDALGDALETEGFEVISAHNGQDGIMKLRSRPWVDLILLDLEMPVSNGFEFKERQEQDPQLSKIPVIIFSGHKPDLDTLMRMKARDYFIKPMKTEALVASIRKHCP
jgi:two-component system chemotaxis response regulator CheY